MHGTFAEKCARLKKDGVCAFLDKSALELDKGSEKLLEAVAGILREMPMDAQQTAGARA